MAKKKKTVRRRRSRISGVGGGNGNVLIGVLLGVVAGKALTKFAGTKINPKILGAAQIGVGYFMPKFVKGPTGTGIGYGLMANGGGQLLTSFGILSGVDDGMIHLEMPAMAGTDQLKAINGADDFYNAQKMAGTDALSVINGMENNDAARNEMTARTMELFS